jgi:c-di-GMP-binding flagellar brake protein YcgR
MAGVAHNYEKADRRSGSRVQLHLPIRIDAGDSRWIDAESKDVSAGGMLLIAAEHLPNGVQIEYIVSIPNFREAKMRCAGKVLRSAPFSIGRMEIAVTMEQCLSVDVEL